MIFYKYVLTYSSPLILILGGVLGLFYFKFLNRIDRIILLYLIISLSFDFLSRTMGNVNNNNLILWPLLSLTELLIFFKLYLNLIRQKNLVWILTSVGVLYIVTEIIYVDSYNIRTFQPYSKVVASFLIVLFVLINLFEHLKNEIEISKRNQYLNSVLLSYFALNIVLLLPINFLINVDSTVTIYIWTAYLIATILFYSCLSFLICKNGKNQKRLHYGL